MISFIVLSARVISPWTTFRHSHVPPSMLATSGHPIPSSLVVFTSLSLKKIRLRCFTIGLGKTSPDSRRVVLSFVSISSFSFGPHAVNHEMFWSISFPRGALLALLFFNNHLVLFFLFGNVVFRECVQRFRRAWLPIFLFFCGSILVPASRLSTQLAVWSLDFRFLFFGRIFCSVFLL